MGLQGCGRPRGAHRLGNCRSEEQAVMPGLCVREDAGACLAAQLSHRHRVLGSEVHASIDPWSEPRDV